MRLPRIHRAALAIALLCVLGSRQTARAVIFYSTSDPNFNTSAPTGSLANSGWQWVGIKGDYAATAIGPNYFLSAKHIGGNVGDPFVFDGVTYTTVAYYDDPETDLRIWQVDKTFPKWAPLYRGSSEEGNSLVVCGTGFPRDGNVMVNGSLAGWHWDLSGTRPLRWGTNTVNSIVPGGTGYGDLLYAVFQQGTGDPNESDLADYDSSGPVFINDGTGWKLAGVNLAVDGPFYTSMDVNTAFFAALFDARGLYLYNIYTKVWTPISGGSAVPSGFYATRVSVRAGWIDSITQSPAGSPLFTGWEAVVFAVLLVGSGLLSLRLLGRVSSTT